MILFYVIRHGNKEAVPFDPPLTPIGVQQATATAEALKQIQFQVIIASPKLRTQQTAHIIAATNALPVITDERLQERLEWESNESFDEFIAEWRKTDLDRTYLPKTGDSSVNKGGEIKSVIDEFSEKYQDGNILIISHGGAIGDLLQNLFGSDTLPQTIDPVTNAPHILISECSITVIKKNDDQYTLTKLNDITHLTSRTFAVADNNQ